MASKIYSAITGNGNYIVELILTSTANVSGNYSTVNYTFQYRSEVATAAYKFSYGNRVYLAINGTVVADTPNVGAIHFSGPATHILATGSMQITHNSDGTMSIPVTGTFTQTQNTAYNATVGGTFTLDTIARASVPTVSASSATIGNSITISTNRKSTSFTHKLTWSCGSQSGTIASSGVGASKSWTIPASVSAGISNASSGTVTITCVTYNGSTTVGTKTCTFTANIPSSTLALNSSSITMGSSITATATNVCGSNLTYKFTWAFGSGNGTLQDSTTMSVDKTFDVATFAPLLPNNPSGTCTITLATYRGTKLINSTNKTFTLAVPSSAVPTITNVTITDPTGHYDSLGLFIQNISTANIITTAQGIYGSTIDSCSVTIDGVSYNGLNSNSNILQNEGSIPVKITVSDSRGRTSEEYNTVLYVAQYQHPSISSYSIDRYNNEGEADINGSYIRLSVTGSISPLNSANGALNTALYKWTYILSNDTEEQIGGNLGTEFDLNFDEIITTHTFSSDEEFTIKLYAIDNIGKTAERTLFLHSAEVPIDVLKNKTGIAFGKVATEERVADFKWDVHTDGALSADGDANVGGNAIIDGNASIVGSANIGGVATLQKGSFVAECGTGASGTAGYIKFATFTITGTYANQQIEMSITQRARRSPATLTFCFDNGNTTTANITSFYISSSTVYNVYASNSADNVIDLYVEKSDGYDYVDVLSLHMGSYMQNRVQVEFKKEYHSSVSNWVQPSPEIVIPVCSGAGGQIRFIHGNYGSFIRNDGGGTYILLTNSGDQYGSFNSLRPFHINHSSGKVTMNNGIETTTINASTNFTYNGVSIVPQFEGSSARGAMWFPNKKIMICWQTKNLTTTCNASWGTGYETKAKCTFDNWYYAFNSVPTTIRQIHSSTNTGILTQPYDPVTATSPGSIYGFRPGNAADATSRTYRCTAIGIGTYT